MKKLVTRFFCASVLAAVAVALLPLNADAAKKKGEKKDPGTAGAITAVNKDDKTITLGGKTITVDSTTVITRDGNPINLEDIKTGEQAQVSTFTQADKLTAVSIKLGKVAPVVTQPKKKK